MLSSYQFICVSRRATCYLQTIRPQLAVADFKKVLTLEPHNETVRAQLVSTQKLIRKIEFEKVRVIGVYGTSLISVPRPLSGREKRIPWSAAKKLSRKVLGSDILGSALIDYLGGCEVDPTYTGPQLPSKDDKYYITEEFIQEMILWFKEGKVIAKRYAWEIVMGARDHFIREESLVDVVIPPGVVCDVIGDVHGKSLQWERADLHD